MSAREWRTSPGLGSLRAARIGAFVISERTLARSATDVAVPEPTLNVSPATGFSLASSRASARSPTYRKSRVCSPSPWIYIGRFPATAAQNVGMTLAYDDVVDWRGP